MKKAKRKIKSARCGGAAGRVASCILQFAFAAAVAILPFERYETIIERMPFGPGPADPDAASATGGDAAGEGIAARQRTAEQQQVAASVRVSALNVTPAGDVKVGFTDSSAKPPVSYYLKVGSSRDGWTVKTADPVAETVSLKRGGVEVTVKLGEGGRVGDGSPKYGIMRTQKKRERHHAGRKM